jgi:hypothetical protein
MFIRFAQLVIVLIPLGIFVWLVRVELVPNGTFVADHNIGESSPYIDALAPQNRLQGGDTIIDDPVFFFLHPHRHFDRVAFEIWFQNTSVPIMEFGGLAQIKPEVFDLQPFHNLFIDRLGWSSVKKDGLTLYQKTKRYQSIEQFYKNPPAREQVAIYKAEYKSPFRIPNYAPSTQTQTMEVSLRGKHELKTYIKNETLDFRFEYMDMNRDEGADPIAITLFNEQNEPIADVRAQDDEHTRGDSIPSSLKELSLRVPDLPEGVYKVVMNAPRDIFFRKIHTTQQKIVFFHLVFLGDEIGYREKPKSARLFSSSPQLRMQTRHAGGVQEVIVDEKFVAIAKPYEMYKVETRGEMFAIDVPKGDIEIFFDGPLAFSKEAYFEPDPIALRPYMNVEEQGIEYVFTSYVPPRVMDEWLVQTVEVDTADLVFDKKSWKFTFSTPDIRARGGEVRIKSINTTWTRQPFEWEDLWGALWMKK